MSLCRRLLSQVHISKTVSNFASSRVHFKDGLHTAPARPKAATFNEAPLETPERRHATHVVSPCTNQLQSKRLESFQSHGEILDNMDAEVKSGHSAMDAYKELRGINPAHIARLPAVAYIQVLKSAFQTHSHAVADQVVTDILEIYCGKDRDSILQTVLSISDFSALARDTIQCVLRHLQKSNVTLDHIPTKAVEQLARVIASDQSKGPLDVPLLELFSPVLLSRLRNYLAPSGASSLTYRPKPILYASFEFIQKLLVESQNSLALELFQVLVDSGHIPPEAIQGVDSSSKDFSLIICSALIRASLHWNWRGLASRSLTRLLQSNSSHHHSVTDLLVDTLYALLDTPNAKDIRSCGTLIREAHRLAPVPDGLLRQFYDSAAQLKQGSEAEAMYIFTRSKTVFEKHQYPPPQGIALTWLMQYLAFKSRRTHLSRELASEVVSQNLPLPIHSRARFISIAAAHGYGVIARTLWERYAVGKDKGVVVGNSALMIRMTSLFGHLDRRSRTTLQGRRHTNAEDSPMETESRKEQSKNLSAFLDRIMSEYRKHHEPLAEARHEVLTSLARSCFIVGKFAEGFEAFKVLMKRKEVPDMYDVNVALTAVAEQNPRSAVRMIERMIEKGLQPDTVTFGTVMHHAMLHKDMPLVTDMIARVRALKDTRLSLKSVVALVRATVAPGDIDFREMQRFKLHGALSIIRTLADSNSVPAPQTGKHLVFESLRANDPVIAYKFWRLLLKDSTDWDDREQIFQRHLISQMILRHYRREKIHYRQAFFILSQLRRRRGIK